MAELLNEFVHEITAKPVVFVVEVIQFIFLMGIFVYAIPKTVGRKLKERRQEIVEQLQEAVNAEKEYRNAEKEAEKIIAKAKGQADQIIKETKENAARVRETTMSQADKETDEIIQQAHRIIETEKEKIIHEACEQLASLVTLTTRQFLDEALTDRERRTLTQEIILSSFEEISVPEKKGVTPSGK